MPSISSEIICLIIVIFVSIMTYMDSDRKGSPVRVVFSRLLFFSIINLLLEMYASYCAATPGVMTAMGLVVCLEAFVLSLMSVLFFGFLFVKNLINANLPSQKKIGNWTGVIVFLLLFTILFSPIFSIRVDGDSIVFSKAIYLIFVLLLIYEAFLALLFIHFRKYINPQRKKIVILAFSAQILCFTVQVLMPHDFMVCWAVCIMIVSFYLTLENSDVKLIEQLSIEKERADKANSVKSDFIANVSHEIRTPINAVLGMDEMILRETNEENIRQYAYDIKTAASTLHGIINEILDLSKMESGKMEILPVNYNMRSLLNDTINMMQLKADDKNLTFVVEADPDIPAGYVGDEVRIKQILTNILSNSMKYTNKGTVKLSLTGTRNDNNTADLHFEISDTGIGMKEEDLEKIAQAYARFDADKNRNIEGTGLGMTITMQLLDLMKSHLDIESEYGKGTTSSFVISQKIWDDTNLGDFRSGKYDLAETYTYEKSFEAPENKVLVVDDNAINRKVFIGLLKQTKLKIDEAESGPECLNMVRKNKYDIIFMDHMMPDMDGIETFHNLKLIEGNMSKDAVVIMLTANAVSGAKEQYMDEGFDDFMAKPIIPEELENMIRKYIK